jgi:hypothetical protein
MFGIKAKSGSSKESVSEAAKLVRGSGSRDVECSSCTYEIQGSEQTNAFNLQAYLSGKQRMREFESQKAFVLSEARHERWKAGGPS